MQQVLHCIADEKAIFYFITQYETTEFLFIRYIDGIIISDLCPERLKFLHDRHLEDTFINTASIYMFIFLDIDIRSS